MTDKPILLDTFCKAGGCTKGYQRAGFYVVGVDIEPQPHYCGDDFLQADALDVLARLIAGETIRTAKGIPMRLEDFAAIHASPPCQAYSIAAKYTKKDYPDLIGPVRDLLVASGKPWILENVPGAPLRADFKLCGCQFGLRLRRQRWFETSWHGFSLLPPCQHLEPVPSVVGHGTPTWVREALGYNPGIAELRACMGIDWMNRGELSQAIPPAYTEWIGRQLLAAIGNEQ